MGSSLYNSFLSKNPSHQERLDLGNSIRKMTSRSSLAEFTVKNNRQTPIDILLAPASFSRVITWSALPAKASL